MQLYLIRHGQAGSRDNYDMLSSLGQSQAQRLGEYFRSAGISFRADSRWNEFSLEGLWKTLAPRLLVENEQFARDYHALAKWGRIASWIASCGRFQIGLCVSMPEPKAD